MTVADHLLLYLWVPLLTTERHNRTHYDSLPDSRDMLVPASSLLLSSLCAEDMVLQALSLFLSPSVNLWHLAICAI